MNKLFRLTLTFFLCLSFTCFTHAQSTVTERIAATVKSVDSGGPRDQARLKQAAVLLAKTRFPVLVEGSETLTGDDYTSAIKAISLLRAEPVILKSNYVSATNVFSGDISVTLDIDASIDLLRKLKTNQTLVEKMKGYVDLIERGILAQDRLTLAMLTLDQKELEDDILLASELTTTYAILSAKEEALFQLRDEMLTHYVEQANWSMVSVNRTEQLFKVRVSGPDMKKAHDYLLTRYDMANMPLLHKGGYVCGISDLGLHFMVDVLPLDEPKKYDLARSPITTFEFDVTHQDSQMYIDRFNTSFDILPCY